MNLNTEHIIIAVLAIVVIYLLINRQPDRKEDFSCWGCWLNPFAWGTSQCGGCR